VAETAAIELLLNVMQEERVEEIVAEWLSLQKMLDRRSCRTFRSTVIAVRHQNIYVRCISKRFLI